MQAFYGNTQQFIRATCVTDRPARPRDFIVARRPYAPLASWDAFAHSFPRISVGRATRPGELL
jgi:hypothetical protein